MTQRIQNMTDMEEEDTQKDICDHHHIQDQILNLIHHLILVHIHVHNHIHLVIVNLKTVMYHQNQ